MKKSTRPDDSRDTRPEATPLTDSWLASIQKGATPGIFPVMWRDGFAVGHGTICNFWRGLMVHKYTKPRGQGEKKHFWTVWEVDFAEDKKTVLEIRRKIEGWFENKKEAEAGLPKCLAWAQAKVKQAVAAKTAAEKTAAIAPSSVAEQDLRVARLKVMREQYPDTFTAMDTLAAAQPEGRPTVMEAMFRAYAVDVMRLRKPAKLGEILPFKLPEDTSFILEIAKAYKLKSPRDPVDVEIAARWYAAGYDKMKPDEYTAAINAKTGANLKPGAMKKRRLKKLRLLSSNPEGSPIREI
jgi:hypothetical protein